MKRNYVKYTKEILEAAVCKSVSMSGVLRELNLAQSGGTHCHILKRIQDFGIDCSHFTRQAHNKGKVANNKISADEILILSSEKRSREKTYKLVRALKEIGRPYKCVECSCGDTYNGKPIVLHVDHINGDSQDNREENLRFICPNCHSQTPTYCRRKDL